MVFLNFFFEKVDFEKFQQSTKIHEKLSNIQRVKDTYLKRSKITLLINLDTENLAHSLILIISLGNWNLFFKLELSRRENMTKIKKKKILKY